MLGDRSPELLERQSQPGPFSGCVQGVWARHRGLLRFAAIVGILVLNFWAGMGPHWDYRFPLHVDEWLALGYTQSMLDEGSLEYPEPYGGGGVRYRHEMGFHLVLGFIKVATGLSWLGLYRVAPGVLVALLAFLVYALGHRDGFGWAAALFVPLIPTSLRTLGPTFLVPVSVAMLFIPATLLLLHRLEAKAVGQSLWLLLILIGGTIFVHPPTEAVVTALAVLYLAAIMAEALAKHRYHAAASLLVAVGVRMLIPLVILGVWLPSLTKTTAEAAMRGDPGLTLFMGFNYGFFEAFGLIAMVLFIWGVFVFTGNSHYGLRSYVLPAFTGFLLVFLNLVYPRYQLGPSILYERGWLYLGLVMAILAGYGVAHYFHYVPSLARIIGARISPRSSDWLGVLLVTAGIAVVATALTTGLVNKDRQRYTSYYHMVNDQVYADFLWLGQHTAPSGKVVMMEPNLAWAYPPLAGPRNTVAGASAAPYRSQWTGRVHQVLATGEVEAEWLREQSISVLYTRPPGSQTYTELKNSELHQIRPGVYLVPPKGAADH